MSTVVGEAKAVAPLVARTVPLTDPGPLLALLPKAGALAWVRRGEGLVGWGSVATIPTSGADRFGAAERAWAELIRHAVVRDEVGLPGTGPVAFGSFAFSPGSPDSFSSTALPGCTPRSMMRFSAAGFSGYRRRSRKRIG